MLDRADHKPLRATLGPGLPVVRMVVGMPVEEVAELLPRVFNLCRAAQRMAVEEALGLPTDGAGLAEETTRDHLLRLAVLLPDRLGLPRLAMAQDTVLAGLPDSPKAFEMWVARDDGIAPLIARLAALFACGEAVAELPLVTDETAGRVVAVENSVAARHADHPVMRHVEQSWGRGPIWRVMARAFDLAHPSRTRHQMPPGQASVPAARGRYFVEALQEAGRVTGFARVTPTDHLMAPGGVMAQSLASLPPAKHDLAPLVVEILDPCSPVTLSGGAANA